MGGLYELQFSFFFEKNEVMIVSTTKVLDEPTESFDSLSAESIDFFVRMMSIMGLPAQLVKFTGYFTFQKYPFQWTKSV